MGSGRHAYRGWMVLWNIYALLCILIGLYGLILTAADSEAQNSCYNAIYYYNLTRSLVGFVFGFWVFATNSRDSSYSPEMDPFEFLLLMGIVGVDIWQIVNLSSISALCRTAMINNSPWTWGTGIFYLVFDLVSLIIIMLLGCLFLNDCYDDVYDDCDDGQYRYIRQPHMRASMTKANTFSGRVGLAVDNMLHRIHASPPAKKTF